MSRIDIEGHGTLDTDAIAFVHQPEWGPQGWSIMMILKQRETPITLTFGKAKLPEDLEDNISARALELYFEHGGVETSRPPITSYDNHERELYATSQKAARKEFRTQTEAHFAAHKAFVLEVFYSIRKSVGTTFATRAGN